MCRASELRLTCGLVSGSLVARADTPVGLRGPGQLWAFRTFLRPVYTLVLPACPSCLTQHLEGGDAGDHASSRCLPSTQQAGSEPYQRGWAVGACARSEVAHGRAAHTSTPTRCESVCHLAHTLQQLHSPKTSPHVRSQIRKKVAVGVEEEGIENPDAIRARRSRPGELASRDLFTPT